MIMPIRDDTLDPELPADLVELTLTVPAAVVLIADRAALAAECNATCADVIRELLVGHLCQVATDEGSFSDRCTAPLDRTDFEPALVADWPNAENRSA